MRSALAPLLRPHTLTDPTVADPSSVWWACQRPESPGDDLACRLDTGCPGCVLTLIAAALNAGPLHVEVAITERDIAFAGPGWDAALMVADVLFPDMVPVVAREVTRRGGGRR